MNPLMIFIKIIRGFIRAEHSLRRNTDSEYYFN